MKRRIVARNFILQRCSRLEYLTGRVEKKDVEELSERLPKVKGLVVYECDYAVGARAMLTRVIAGSSLKCLSVQIKSNTHFRNISKAIRKSGITQVSLTIQYHGAYCAWIKTWDKVTALCLDYCSINGSWFAGIIFNTNLTEVCVNNEPYANNWEPFNTVLRFRRFKTLHLRNVPIEPQYVATGIRWLKLEYDIPYPQTKQLHAAIAQSTSLERVDLDIKRFPEAYYRDLLAHNWNIHTLRTPSCTVKRSKRALRDVFQWLLVNRRLKLVCKDVQGIISFLLRREARQIKKRRLE